MKIERTFTIEKIKGNEWGDILTKFLKRINQSRIDAGYKPLTEKGLGAQLSRKGYKTTNAIRDLYKECDQAQNFGKLLNYKLKH